MKQHDIGRDIQYPGLVPSRTLLFYFSLSELLQLLLFFLR